MRLLRASALAIVALLAGCGAAHTGLGRSGVLPVPRPSSDVIGAPVAIYVANVRLANLVHIDASGNPLLTMTGGVEVDGVATDDAGNVYVAGNQKNVLVYSPSTSAQTGSFTDATLGGLHGIAVTAGATPTVFVMDALLSTIDGYPASARGATSAQYAITVPQPTDGKPIAIAVDGTGTLFFLAAGGPNNLAPKVFACDPPGYASCTATNIAPAADASGLAAAISGTLYISTATTLAQYTPTGPHTYVAGVSLTTGLCGVQAIGAGGTIVAATQICSGSTSAPAIATFDQTTLAPGITIGGSGSQLSTTHNSTVAVQSNAANADTVYAGNALADSVTGYCAHACSATPSVFLDTGYPGLDGVQALLFAGGDLYTADAAAQAISIYAAPSNAATGTTAPAPIARILGSATGICGPAYVSLDSSSSIYVADACDNINVVTVYPPIGGSTGNQNPTPRTIGGPTGLCSATLMCNPQQMVFDAQNHLYVTNYGTTNGYSPPGAAGAGAIDIFDGPTGALLAIVKSSDIHNPSGLAWTPDGLLAVLSNTSDRGTPEVAFFTPPGVQASPGTPVVLTPVRVLSGAATQIGAGSKPTPFPQMVIDANGLLYIDEFVNVLEFAPNASGNTAPTVLTGTGINGGTGIAIGSVL